MLQKVGEGTRFSATIEYFVSLRVVWEIHLFSAKKGQTFYLIMLCAFCVCEFLGILILNTSRHLTLTFHFYISWLEGSVSCQKAIMMDLFKLHAVIIIWSQSGLVAIMYFCQGPGRNSQTKEGREQFQGIPLDVLTNRQRHYSLDSFQLSWFQRIFCNNKKYPIRTSESSDLPVLNPQCFCSLTNSRTIFSFVKEQHQTSTNQQPSQC